MDIIQIIDELEQEFIGSKNFLWSKKSLVNMDRLASLIAELKANLPEAVQEASYVLSKKEQILNNAKAEARKTIAEAEFRAEQLVSSSEIFKKSERESAELLAQTNKKCAELYMVTKSNVDKMLKSVELYLDQNLQMVKQNRADLDVVISKIRMPEQPSQNDDTQNETN